MAHAKIAEPPHLVADLKTLCLATIAAYWERFAQEAESKRQPHADYLADLVSFEVAKRRERRIQRRIQEARFPILKTLDGFDFSAQPGLDRNEVLELFRCAFVAEAANAVLLGGVGPATYCSTSLRGWKQRDLILAMGSFSEQSHRSMGNPRFTVTFGDGFEFLPSPNVIRIRLPLAAADLA